MHKLSPQKEEKKEKLLVVPSMENEAGGIKVPALVNGRGPVQTVVGLLVMPWKKLAGDSLWVCL